jgi:hypothetical protein
MKTKLLFKLFALLVVLSVAVGAARAGEIFTVTLDTNPLTLSPAADAGPFSIAFQLTDGSGTNDGNNTATLSNFDFGGGSASGTPTLYGVGTSGDLGSTVTLTDNDFFNAFVQGFIPGSSLSFLAGLTTNVDAGGTPDAFAFSILDSSGSSIPTVDPADTLLTVNIDSASPTILTYATDPNQGTASGDVSITMGAPVTNLLTPVPEPTLPLLMCVGLFGVCFAAWRIRDR